MNKTFYLLHIVLVTVHARYLAAVVGSDIAIYVYSLIAAAWLIVSQKIPPKTAALNLLCILSLTSWGSYFLMAAEFQLVTQKLRYIKSLAVGFIVAAEVVGAAIIVRRYLTVRSGRFACESFSLAIDPYPLGPELRKIFLVEFNIWRALLIRLRLMADADGNSLMPISKINPGYKAGHILLAFSFLLFVNAIFFWLIGGWWILIPTLASIYVALVLNCEITTFANCPIYDNGNSLKIPNGIFGFVSISKSNVRNVLSGNTAARCDLSVSRIIPGNLQIHLAQPILISGAPVKSISVCVDDPASLQACLNSHEGASQ